MQALLDTLKEIVSGIFSWKLATSTAFTVFAFLFGVGLGKILIGLLVLTAVDFILGIALCEKRKCEITPQGIFRSAQKLGIYSILIVSSHLVDVSMGLNNVFEQYMIFYLSLTEFASILRNTGHLGYAIPRRILNMTEEMKHKYD